MNQVKNKKIKLVFYRTLFSQSGASLTMGSIAAILREKGHRVDLCFLERKDHHAAEKILKGREEYNIIIAKPNFKDYEELFDILVVLKKYNKIDKIFLCGPYACLNAESLMDNCDWLDGIITGAIEETSLALIDSFSGDCGNFDTNCPGGIWRDPTTGRINSNKARNATMTLSELPFPARDIEKLEGGKYVNIEASRGCVFRCSFCHNPIMSGFNNKRGIVDIRDPELVVDEMEHLYKTLGKTLFIFNDDCFWRGPIDDDRIRKFCSQIKKRGLDIKFYVYLRCKPFIGEEILKELVKVGLVRVFLGVENVSKVSQVVFNKPMGEDVYLQVKKKLEAHHVNIHIGYIVFEPYSTPQDILLNIGFLFKIGKLFRLGTILEPVRVVPYSELHVKLIEDNLMRKDLKYHEITYGYKFLHPEVGKLLEKFKELFCVILHPIAYEYEYYCTTAKLIEILLKREGDKYKEIITNDFGEFNQARDESMELLLKYFESKISLAMRSDPSGLDWDDKNFIGEFRSVCQLIKIKYADIITKIIENGGRNIIEQIYTGLDKI